MILVQCHVHDIVVLVLAVSYVNSWVAAGFESNVLKFTSAKRVAAAPVQERDNVSRGGVGAGI